MYHAPPRFASSIPYLRLNTDSWITINGKGSNQGNREGKDDVRVWRRDVPLPPGPPAGLEILEQDGHVLLDLIQPLRDLQPLVHAGQLRLDGGRIVLETREPLVHFRKQLVHFLPRHGEPLVHLRPETRHLGVDFPDLGDQHVHHRLAERLNQAFVHVLNPTHSRAGMQQPQPGMGDALLRLDRAGEAAAAYEAALALNPAYAKAHNNLGNVQR